MHLTLHTNSVAWPRWSWRSGQNSEEGRWFNVSAGCIARPEPAKGQGITNPTPAGFAGHGSALAFWGLLGRGLRGRRGQWLEMEPLLPSKQPWQDASSRTLEGGGSTNRGSQQIPQRRSVSGPCSSWGTAKEEKRPSEKALTTAQRPANTRAIAIRHLTSFLIGDGRRSTWHHDLSMPWENSQQTRR